MNEEDGRDTCLVRRLIGQGRSVGDGRRHTRGRGEEFIYTRGKPRMCGTSMKGKAMSMTASAKDGGTQARKMAQHTPDRLSLVLASRTGDDEGTGTT